MNEYSSKKLETAVNELSRLPGIGKKTALRLAFFILGEDSTFVERLANSLIKMRGEVIFCKRCNNISDNELCNICSNHKRDENTICIVENSRDVMAVENTGQYNGLYHVLGGIINPIEGIGPGDIKINTLLQRFESEQIKEIIFALPATVEGDTTNFYIYKMLKNRGVKITSIARGVAIGDYLEYTDEITLGRSILNRLPFEGSVGE